ncbi:MAG: aromatic ring-hydroxylating dioxygenase subunit alpha [Phenylobacterium sp.]|uniref:aromatic ring-hydroxylating oxygenase subunit alpha n=1 Tax=Phenylobacterium sp. TaxID=1871053 RepID=UPI002735F109|nr:aromatic ring-hydroxylating dioxygenase subunit alpha [Phenylobacterium sp.]MDP3175050.1 aromatic ring-hydroxylating dioxygenase subunit alpha [Phenylobacterium sp.]
MPDFGGNAAGLIIDDRESGIFRVHRSAFIDDDILKLERERIFDKSWLFAGHISEFPKPGDFITRNVGGRPIILVTSDDGEVRALMNTCRHRGNLVCREHKGSNAEVFRCFYHGWIYNTRGELKGIPGEEAYSEAFDRESLGLEPAPKMHNHRGCIFISFDPDMEDFESYMGPDALMVIDNTLNLGDMEFVEGHFKYSMRANWKLLVENSMDGYHAAFTHERFFAQWLPSMGLGGGGGPMTPQPAPPNDGKRRGAQPMGNGHVTTAWPTSDRRINGQASYLEKFAGAELEQFREGLVKKHGDENARMIEGRAGNYLIFPNLLIIDGWCVFRTFYPTTPDYMEINGWAAMPKEDTPALRKARLDWYLGFQGPGGFATPDDVEGLEGCQMGFATNKEVEWSDISRGMKGNTKGGPTELQMRVFWREWEARLTTGQHAEYTGD